MTAFQFRKVLARDAMDPLVLPIRGSTKSNHETEKPAAYSGAEAGNLEHNGTGIGRGPDNRFDRWHSPRNIDYSKQLCRGIGLLNIRRNSPKNHHDDRAGLGNSELGQRPTRPR